MSAREDIGYKSDFNCLTLIFDLLSRTM